MRMNCQSKEATLTVIKADGSREPFSKDKIVSSMMREFSTYGERLGKKYSEKQVASYEYHSIRVADEVLNEALKRGVTEISTNMISLLIDMFSDPGINYPRR